MYFNSHIVYVFPLETIAGLWGICLDVIKNCTLKFAHCVWCSQIFAESLGSVYIHGTSMKRITLSVIQRFAPVHKKYTSTSGMTLY